MTTTIDNKTLWKNTLSELELDVSKANFSTWFRDTFIVKIDDGVVVIGVPNTFVRDWLLKKFDRAILKTLRDQDSNIKAVEYTVAKIDKIKQKENTEAKPKNDTQAMPLSEYYIDKDDNLNPRYTFDTFIIGSFNELAYAASQAIIKQPGIVYNPLFIYGKTGHGKTHLIQSIGNRVKKDHPDTKIFYLTSEKFASDCYNALQNNKMDAFKAKYRKYDLLIMDDIQFFSNKEKMQEELFHLFNSLYDNNKQIVFSSDQHPNFIPGLEERLKSRFNQGMIVDIPKPDSDSRSEILRKKAESGGVILSEEIINYLTTSVESNIRELEGIVNSIVCQTQLRNKNLNINDVKELIKNNTEPQKMISIKDLIKIVADFFNIDPETICDKTRRKEVVRPRQITMYILREDFNTSYPTIGEKMGKRDHTTVIHSCEKIKKDLKKDPTLVQQLSQIRSMI